MRATGFKIICPLPPLPRSSPLFISLTLRAPLLPSSLVSLSLSLAHSALAVGCVSTFTRLLHSTKSRLVLDGGRERRRRLFLHGGHSFRYFRECGIRRGFAVVSDRGYAISAISAASDADDKRFNREYRYISSRVATVHQSLFLSRPLAPPSRCPLTV